MPTFSQSFHSHLAEYKARCLGVSEEGIFLYRGKPVPRAHILPKELQWLNILEPCRAEVQAYLAANPAIKLHKYFHHLNSSQAFAFNLFYPFFEMGGTTQLLNALGLPGTVSHWQPELVPNAEEGTNVDVAWQGSDGAWTYCEVKLTEAEFGAAIDDERHREKLSKIYRPILDGHCDPSLLEPDGFFCNYQILRNLWLVARQPDASLVFLLPKGNAALWVALRAVLGRIGPTISGRISAVGIEDVLLALRADETLPPQLTTQAELLFEKYSLVQSVA
jgi:hypothetical protein